MPWLPSRLVRLPLALAIAAALAFGAQSALANPARATCPYDPGSGKIGLSCTRDAAGNAMCSQQCKAVIGDWSNGFCGYTPPYGNCCICAY